MPRRRDPSSSSASSSDDSSSDGSSSSRSGSSSSGSDHTTSNTHTSATTRTGTTTTATSRSGATTTATATTTSGTTRTGTTSGTATTSHSTSAGGRRVAFSGQRRRGSSSSDDSSSSSSGTDSSSDSSDDDDETSRTGTTTTRSSASPSMRTRTAGAYTSTAGSSDSDSDSDDDSSSSGSSSSSSDSGSQTTTRTGTTTATTSSGATRTTNSSSRTGTTTTSRTTTNTRTSNSTTATHTTTGTTNTSSSGGTTSTTRTGTSTATGTTTATGTSRTTATATGTSRTETPRRGRGGSRRRGRSSSSSHSSSGSSSSSSGSSDSDDTTTDTTTTTTSRSTASTTTTGTSRSGTSRTSRRSSRTGATTTSAAATSRRGSRSRSRSNSKAATPRPQQDVEAHSKSLSDHIQRTKGAMAMGGSTSTSPRTEGLRPLPVITIPSPPARRGSRGGTPTTSPPSSITYGGASPSLAVSTAQAAANVAAHPVARAQTDVDVAAAIALSVAAVGTARAVHDTERAKGGRGAFDPRLDRFEKMAEGETDSRASSLWRTPTSTNNNNIAGAENNNMNVVAGNRYGLDGSAVLNRSTSTIGTADLNRTDPYLSPDRNTNGYSSPSGLAAVPVTTRLVRPQYGVAATASDARRERLNAANMIRYGCPADTVAATIARVAARQAAEEALAPEAERTPDGSLSAANVRRVLRAFGWAEAAVREADRAAGPHSSASSVQAMVERENLVQIPRLLLRRFTAIDSCRSGEVTLRECNRLLVNSKIGAAAIGRIAPGNNNANGGNGGGEGSSAAPNSIGGVVAAKVHVKLAMFRWSLGVSVQQYSDPAEFFDLSPEANFRLSYQANNDVVINAAYAVTGLDSAERDELLQALHACAHIRTIVDAATVTDDNEAGEGSSPSSSSSEPDAVCYEPLLANLMAHPKGWMAATAAAAGVKSLFRERLVASLYAPSLAELAEWERRPIGVSDPKQLGLVGMGMGFGEPHQDPFLLSTVATAAQRQSNHMPTLRRADCTLERAAGDSSAIFATLKFSEIRLPNEKIPLRSPFYILASLVSESGAVVAAARLYAAPQKKAPSDLWVFPKGEDALSFYGSPSDLVYIEICHSSTDSEAASREAALSRGGDATAASAMALAFEPNNGSGGGSEALPPPTETEHSCGFSSCRLDCIKEGVTSMVVSGGTIYDRTLKAGGEERVKSGFFPCSSKVLATRILVEASVGKKAAYTPSYSSSKTATFPDAQSLPPRFVIDSRHVELLALCREAIFDRLERRKVGGVAHPLNITRDHIVRQALLATEDGVTMGALAAAWASQFKKYEKEQRADRNFVHHQLLALMAKVTAARNCVAVGGGAGGVEELLRIVKGDANIVLQTRAPLRPVIV